MRLLFAIDLQDYAACTRTFRRDSARGIILQSGKVAMIHSRRDGYYKFPGGGIEAGESLVEAMIREVHVYGKVARLGDGARLIVCGEADGWANIRTARLEGWAWGGGCV